MDTREKVINNLMHRIHNRRVWQKRIRIGSHTIIGISCLIAVFPATSWLLSYMSNTGVYEYISLAFGNSVTISNMKIILLSILESAPLFEIAITGILALLFLNSIKSIIRNYYWLPNYKTKII